MNLYKTISNFKPEKNDVDKHLHRLKILDECNEILASCKNEEERMRQADLIRSKVSLNPINDLLLGAGEITYLN